MELLQNYITLSSFGVQVTIDTKIKAKTIDIIICSVGNLILQ